jgi:hypothetical protein
LWRDSFRGRSVCVAGCTSKYRCFSIMSQSTVALPRSLHSMGHLATDEVLRDTMKDAVWIVDSSWNVMVHGDAREGKWWGNWRMEWVASTLHTISERSVSNISIADAHTSAASSRLNWRPRRFKWTRPFLRKTKSGFCACTITFQLACTYSDISGEGRGFCVFVHQVCVSSAHRFHYRCGESNHIIKLNVQEGALDETPVELDESVQT